VTCAKCDHVLTVGDWPFCPHPRGYAVAVIDDQIEGGPRFFDTMGPEDVWIESKSQWRREVEKRELIHVDRHDRHYYQTKFKQHDERLRDLGL
jgi:hypothetical protein